LKHREPTENDIRGSRFTLKRLLDEGLINRLRYFEPDRVFGMTSFVYGLTDKGVKEWGGKTFDEHSERTLDHELEISYFHIELKKLCKKEGWELYWKQKDLKCGISPDAYFAITKPEGTFHFFLEVERAKIGNYRDGKPSIIRKLGKYFEYYNSDQCQKEWNFRLFRTIVIQRTDERRDNLLKTLHEQFNHRTFWLTTENDYKQANWAHIFKTPKDYEKVAYSFMDL
jgi:hypothetical protein